EDPGARSHDDIRAQRGMALLLPQARATERHPVKERHILADLGGFTDDDTHPMVDEESGSEPRGGMDLDAGEEAADVREEAGRRPEATPPEPVRGPVEPDRVHAGIAERYLERRTSRGIA